VYRVSLKHKRFIDDQFEEDLARGDYLFILRVIMVYLIRDSAH